MLRDRWAQLRAKTAEAVLRGPGHAPAALRSSVAKGEGPSEITRIVEKIRKHAYRVTDEDIEALRSKYTEDQIFELVVATAVGVAGDKLDKAMAAIEGVAAPGETVP